LYQNETKSSKLQVLNKICEIMFASNMHQLVQQKTLKKYSEQVKVLRKLKENFSEFTAS
jgi:hypothetical protein